MTHNFDVKIAKIYGVDGAIIIHNLYFWIEKNRANNKEKVFSKLSKFVMMKMGVKFVDILKSIIILISIDSNQIILLFSFVML